MRKLRQYMTLVILGNWVAGIWHLFLAAKVVAPPNNNGSWIAISVMTGLHLAVLAAVWKLPVKGTGIVSCLFFLAALVSGVYEHFLHPGANNIFKIVPSDSKTLFDASVYILAGLELLGCWLATRFLTGG